VTEPFGHAGPTQAALRTPRRRSLHRGEQGELVLSYYPAGHAMAEHSHELDQSSIILSGALAEDTPSDAAAPGACYVGFKAAGVRHENRYGPDGALILSLNAAPRSGHGAQWRWSPSESASQISAIVSAFVGLTAPSGDALADLQALLSAPSEERGRDAPPWLVRVREAVRADPDSADVQALADEAGVHRVHLSRAYSRHFQAPISLDRRRVRMARAVKALMEDGVMPADAAYEAGFADQPHFARTLKAETGWTPRRLMRVFADAPETTASVTSVQDRDCQSDYRAAS